MALVRSLGIGLLINTPDVEALAVTGKKPLEVGTQAQRVDRIIVATNKLLLAAGLTAFLI